MTMGMSKRESLAASRVPKGNSIHNCPKPDLLPHPEQILLALVVCLAMAGCVQVPAHQQRLVSKPNMEFPDSLVFNYQNRLLPQVEPGSTFSGGAQSSGCASCK